MKISNIIFFLVLLLLTNCEDTPEKDEDPVMPSTFLKYGNGKFSFNQYTPLVDKPINVYTYLPLEGVTDVRKAVKAMWQGQHRFAKAKKFYQFTANKAAELGVDFEWIYPTLPNVGHSF